MSPPRDYYADLELPPTADIQDIKKQFRKLALKYHPDRNPGREQEVHSKFLIIQSAHEILSDPQQKANYDATLGRSSRYPGASGVRGNPWSHVSEQFPTPPRRGAQPAARNATSGQERWQRFSSGVPPTAKQPTASRSDAKKSAAKAFEGMRKGQSTTNGQAFQRDARPSAPPPPPRSESTRQRAQASFGARKSGYQSSAFVSGEQPTDAPGRSGTGTSTPRPPPRPPLRDPLSHFRDTDADNSMDSRQSTPYTKHGGERTNPFEGVLPSRAKSTRDMPQRRDQSPDDFTRRSSSVPRRGTKDGTGPSLEVPADQSRPYTTAEPSSTASNPPYEYTEHGSDNAAYAARSAKETYASSGRMDNPGPSMYGTPQYHQPSPNIACPRESIGSKPSRGSWLRAYDEVCSSGSRRGVPFHRAPSGDRLAPLNPLQFEKKMHQLLDRLIANSKEAKQRHTKANGTTSTVPADKVCPRFNYPDNDETFARTSPDPNRFARSSIDDINLKFTDDQEPSQWKFNAGNGEATGTAAKQSRPASRPGRQNSNLRQSTQRTSKSNPDLQSPKSEEAFDVDGWSDKFGPDTFARRPEPAAPISPARVLRTNSRKPKSVRPTAGTAAVVIDDSSDEDTFQWPGRKGPAKTAGVESPQAMDIDSPPPEAAAQSSGTNDARNIPVEPSRPEWRSGNFERLNGNGKNADRESKPFDANTAGSEDTEEFRASFADLRNVEPLAKQGEGLKSMADLKDTLPHESKASSSISNKLPKAQPLILPTPPQAPKLPPTVAINGMKPTVMSWHKYLADFTTYLQEWDAFNAQVVDHFSTRKSHVARQRSAAGYAFLGARSDLDVQDYYNWVQQDNGVRASWLEACEEHEKQYRAFLAFREKMK